MEKLLSIDLFRTFDSKNSNLYLQIIEKFISNLNKTVDLLRPVFKKYVCICVLYLIPSFPKLIQFRIDLLVNQSSGGLPECENCQSV